MYLMKWFKIRYPDKVDVSTYSLMFKNLKTDDLEDTLNKLKKEFGNF
jgi:hypothetical protein